MARFSAAGAVAHAAAIFAGTDVQAQVQARLNAPVVAVGLEQRRGCQRGGGPGGEQIFGVDLPGGVLLAVHAPGQPGGWFDEGEIHRLRRGGEGDQAAGFGAAPIALAGLDGDRLDRRGKKRATDSGRVVARCYRRLSDCL